MYRHERLNSTRIDTSEPADHNCLPDSTSSRSPAAFHKSHHMSVSPEKADVRDGASTTAPNMTEVEMSVRAHAPIFDLEQMLTMDRETAFLRSVVDTRPGMSAFAGQPCYSDETTRKRRVVLMHSRTA